MNPLSSTIEKYKLKLNNLSGSVSDGAPVIVSKNKNVISYLQKQANIMEIKNYSDIPHYAPTKSLCKKCEFKINYDRNNRLSTAFDHKD